MSVLFVIGLVHLLFLWSGDILALYALMGMLLPLFRRCSNRLLLAWAALLLLLPVGVDAVVESFGLHPSAWFGQRMWHYCGVFGISEERYAYWLQEQTSYVGVLQFLVQGAFERMTEFIDGNRYFKVLGLFVLGFYVGRNRLYARLEEIRPMLRRLLAVGSFGVCPLASSMRTAVWSIIRGGSLSTRCSIRSASSRLLSAMSLPSPLPISVGA